MPRNDNAETLTVTELTRRWRCDGKRIYEAIHEGRLTAFRVGKRAYRVTIAEVERFERGEAA